jgi:hypothetical protein
MIGKPSPREASPLAVAHEDLYRSRTHIELYLQWTVGAFIGM